MSEKYDQERLVGFQQEFWVEGGFSVSSHVEQKNDSFPPVNFSPEIVSLKWIVILSN